MLDDPNGKMDRSGFFNPKCESETSVHLIFQKGEGTQHSSPEYLMVNCTIVIKKGFAHIPQLNNVLSSYCTQASSIKFSFRNGNNLACIV